MYKIKVFKVMSCDALESKINRWFKDNTNIEVSHTDYFRNNGWYSFSLIYKESETNEVD